MANEWIDDENVTHREALEDVVSPADADDVRYRLTPLGMRALEEDGAFCGFGPCAASGTSAQAAHVTRNGRPREGKRRPPASLFG